GRRADIPGLMGARSITACPCSAAVSGRFKGTFHFAVFLRSESEKSAPFGGYFAFSRTGITANLVDSLRKAPSWRFFVISETALNRELGAGVEIGPFRPFPVLSDGPWRGDPSPGMVDYRREERRQARA